MSTRQQSEPEDLVRRIAEVAVQVAMMAGETSAVSIVNEIDPLLAPLVHKAESEKDGLSEASRDESIARFVEPRGTGPEGSKSMVDLRVMESKDAKGRDV